MMWSINIDTDTTDGFLISTVALHNNHVFVIAYKLEKNLGLRSLQWLTCGNVSTYFYYYLAGGYIA